MSCPASKEMMLTSHDIPTEMFISLILRKFWVREQNCRSEPNLDKTDVKHISKTYSDILLRQQIIVTTPNLDQISVFSTTNPGISPRLTILFQVFSI